MLISFFSTIASLVIFSQYLRNLSLPLPFFTRSKGCHVVQSNLLKLFPVNEFYLINDFQNPHYRRHLLFEIPKQVLITIVAAWLLCLILTAAGALPDDPTQVGYRARTDVKMDVLISSPWFVIYLVNL